MMNLTSRVRSRILPQVIMLGQLGALGVILWPLLFSGVDWNFYFQLLVVAIVLLTICCWQCVPLLLAFQIVLFFYEPRSLEIMEGFGGIVYVIVAIGLLMHVCNLKSTQHAVVARIFARPATATDLSSGNSSQSFNEKTAGGGSCAQVKLSSLLPHTISRAIIFTLVAQLVLATTPAMPDMHSFAGTGTSIQARHWLENWPNPTLIVLLVGLVVFANLVVWRRLSARQSRLYIHSIGSRILHRDLLRIVKAERRKSILRG